MTKSTLFALVPKVTNSAYFDMVRDGCIDGAAALSNVECIYTGIEVENATAQALHAYELIDSGNYSGIALAVIDPTIAEDVIAKARSSGMAAVTFDSDAPNSQRQAYIGTNNTAFGEFLGKVLVQIDPNGGTYGVISSVAPNLEEREMGLQSWLDGSKWKETSNGSPKYCMNNTTLALEQMWEFTKDPEVDTVIPVGGWPMFDKTGWKDFVNGNKNRFRTLISADATQPQIDLLNTGYVNGLVGQMPYVMGHQSIEVLYNLTLGETTTDTVYGTTLLQLLSVPLVLPELNVDMNYLGGLVYFGYTFCAIITIISLGFGVWTVFLRNNRTIRAAQPPFLIMICVGTLIMGFTLIPLSFDDNNKTIKQCNAACIAIPWLVSIGFTISFSALFSKTWRLNKVVSSSQRCQRIVVEPKDVLWPFIILFIANMAILLVWSIFDPLQYQRSDLPGTDDWNRILATYGRCSSHLSYIFLSLLGVVNFGAITLSSYQAYKGRHIDTLLSESKYIFIITLCLLQALLLGIPVLFLTRSNPQGLYIISVILISIITLTILFLIFIPKMLGLGANSKASRRSLSSGGRYSAEEIDGSRFMINGTCASEHANTNDDEKSPVDESTKQCNE